MGMGMGIPFEQAASASLVGDSLTQRVKREREREWRKSTREVSSAHQTMQSLAGIAVSFPPMAAHAWADAWRVSTTTPNLPLPSVLPDSLLLFSPSLFFYPPILCPEINVKQLINTAACAVVRNDRCGWSICQDSPMQLQT